MKSYPFKASLPFEFEVKDLSQMNRKASSITGIPHRANFYQIIWINSGETTQMVDFTPANLSAGQLLFIGKNQVISFDVESEYSGEIILFTDAFFIRNEFDNRFINHIGLFNSFTVNTPIQTNSKIDSIRELINNEYISDNDTYSPDIIHHLLSSLLIYSERAKDNTENPVRCPDYETAMQFSEQVELNYKTMRKVNDYVEYMGISSKVLYKALKSTIGKNPKQFIDERILLEAKRLLVYSDISIKEISFDLGFDEPTNFSKFFREQMGLSPVDFKKQHSA